MEWSGDGITRAVAAILAAIGGMAGLWALLLKKQETKGDLEKQDAGELATVRRELWDRLEKLEERLEKNATDGAARLAEVEAKGAAERAALRRHLEKAERLALVLGHTLAVYRLSTHNLIDRMFEAHPGDSEALPWRTIAGHIRKDADMAVDALLKDLDIPMAQLLEPQQRRKAVVGPPDGAERRRGSVALDYENEGVE